ncbi:MAG: DUF5681 domain-containing protein [Acetobacteraceae bacterium]
MPDDPPYEVGYGRPPRHTRFAKGTSGNPKGRPKDARNLATLLGEVLAERFAVTENGKRRTITKREAIITELVNKSAAADLKAMTLLFGMMQQIEARAGAAGISASGIAEADDAVMKNLAARLRAALASADDGSHSS